MALTAILTACEPSRQDKLDNVNGVATSFNLGRSARLPAATTPSKPRSADSTRAISLFSATSPTSTRTATRPVRSSNSSARAVTWW